MATYDRSPSAPAEAPQNWSWASGGIGFAICVLGILGVFQIVAGLTALIDDEFYVVTENYVFDLDVTIWGCVHLLIGVVMLATAGGLFTGAEWARVSAICLATLSAIVNFFFIPFYPFWAIVVIALNVWVIWALTRPEGARA